MRSWNNISYLLFTYISPSSQFTNEELKLVFCKNLKSPISSKFAIYQWGVETTSIVKLKEKIWPCSQFTNEELKRRSHTKMYYMGNSLFAIYQWGVETPFCVLIKKWRKAFAIYQWGVETKIGVQPADKLPVVRNLPMRSWNKVDSDITQYTLPVRNLPMRSWNLLVEKARGQQALSSQFTNEELKP